MRADGGLVASGTRDGPVVLNEVADDGTVRLLDADLPGPPGLVETVAFSSDGRYLAGGGGEGAVHPAAPRSLDPLTGPVGRIMAVAFHPDGGALAAAVNDGTTWVWDLDGTPAPDRWATFRLSEASLFSLAYHPSGQLLYASGADGELRRWVTDPEVARDRLCGGIGTSITEDEWPRYFLDRPYQPPC
jgi:hypothetical protein